MAVFSSYKQISSVRLRGVELTLFASLEALFMKLDEQVATKIDGTGAKSIADVIHKLLFQYDAKGYIESTRLQRAKALVALSKVPNTELLRATLPADGLKAEVVQEPSSAVQDLLRQAQL